MNNNNNNNNSRPKTYSKDSLLRRFSRMVMDEAIVDEVKDRMFFKSPSEIRKEKNKHRGMKKRRPVFGARPFNKAKPKPRA